MNPQSTDRVFAGSIPELYEKYLVPLIFEHYAVDLATRVQALAPGSVLELAAGTGVVTRRLVSVLPAGVPVVATDLNQPMLDHAAAIGTVRDVEWRQADAMSLPFSDESFDVVVCEFGVMFFTDKAKAFSEARRVVRPGGTFIFSVWDRIEVNEFAGVVTLALAGSFPADPPRFMARVPHGYHAQPVIAHDLRRGGFDRTAVFDTVTARSRADSPRSPAIAYCEGTPLRNEIEARDSTGLSKATETAAAAIADRFGQGQVDGRIQAHLVTVRR